jgi:hypothetical protein
MGKRLKIAPTVLMQRRLINAKEVEVVLFVPTKPTCEAAAPLE